MGKTTIVTPRQQTILNRVCDDRFFTDTFYFTGGTALSEFYLHHRLSDDLDFFSDLPYDPQRILAALTGWSKTLHFTIQNQFVDPTHICLLTYPDKAVIKVDFARYPYPSLAPKTMFKGSLRVDSLLDIAVNKLVTLTQRSEVKDFVDLYYLFDTFTFWDLRDGAKEKFHVELEPYMVAANFMAVEDFDYLPIMRKKLTVEELKEFYRKKAQELSKKNITP